jgi:hypothetical protein
MCTSTSALRIEQLKQELRKEEAAVTATKTLASELAEADKAVNEGQRQVRVNKARIAEEVAVLEGLSKEGALIPQGMSGVRVNHDLKTQRVNQSIHELTVESDRLAGELSKKEYAFGKIEKKIAEHPVYRAVRQKQRELVAEATKLASTLLQLPLSDMSPALNEISVLAEAEGRLINNALGTLRENGLPDLRRLLVSFTQRVTPLAVLDVLPGIVKENREAIRQVTEMASRDVLR